MRVGGRVIIPLTAIAKLLGDELVLHHARDEIPCVDHESRTNEVAVHSVPHPSSASLNLDEDPKIIVNRVHFVGDATDPLFAKEHRPADLCACSLAAFHLEAEAHQPRTKLRRDAIAIQFIVCRRVYEVSTGANDRRELANTAGRPRSLRVVVPSRVVRVRWRYARSLTKTSRRRRTRRRSDGSRKRCWRGISRSLGR